jgi:CHAT domain-containing protein
VARELGAQQGDVFLGARATETLIKKLNVEGVLADRRVVHFATHGLVTSETERVANALAEPALILTPPQDANDADDGLLTASEVAQLNLDADWVVLSACNTAAGGEKGDVEALSGLARAFFYARARALLVSHWYVDSSATVALITRSFAELNADPTIGRAEALRRSMLALIATGGRNAHPANWAPFVVVGEGGASSPGSTSAVTSGAPVASPVSTAVSGGAGSVQGVDAALGQSKAKKKMIRRPKPDGEWDWLWGE